MQGNSKLHTAFAMMISAAFSLLSFLAYAQGAGPSASEATLSAGFAHVCRACHMSDGKGAVGAGTYPSLAGNRNLEASGYPLDVVVNGRRGMPPFGTMMSDDQVAAVVNYLRTHFGNNYQDTVTTEDVGIVRR